MSEMNKPVTQLMEERGFKLCDVTKLEEANNKHCFRFIWGYIIVEVIANGIYRFIYTNEQMLGYVNSGWLDNLTNTELFEKRLLMFNKTIKPLIEEFEYE